MCLISTFYRLLLELASVMTAPTFQSFVILTTGWLFAGRRTVTGIIQAARAVGVKHHSAFHRFFASARWGLDHLGLALLDLILRGIPAETVLEWYARRWSLEVTIHDSKGYLGFEEPQGWTRRAVERTAPMAMLLYSLIVLWFATHGHRHVRFPYRPWYRQKREPSFADMLTTLRRQCLRETFLETPEWNRGSLKVLHSLVELCARAA
jgi:hypothetical protein